MNSCSLKPWVVLVGGFLGSGKTTLIFSAARELDRRRLRSAVIFNDQGKELVDSRYAGLSGLRSGEVVGGCFCCKLSDLVHAMEEMRAYSPDVIFAEPVGSCADLSATVLRPLQEDSERFRLAPVTVLVDPQRAKSLLEDGADPNIRFLFEKQLQEADLVCFTKSDAYPDYPDVGAEHVRQVSAISGQGVAAWLDEVLSGEIAAARHALEIDYRQYAKAEAALAWLDLQAVFRPAQPISPAMMLGPLLDDLDAALSSAAIPVVHLKAIVTSPVGFVKAAICANGQEPTIEGNLDASPAEVLELLLNLRAVAEPDRVGSIVEKEFRKRQTSLEHLDHRCFSPAAPVPERRILEAIP